MTLSPSLGVIHIRNLRLWAHVGVLERERLYGQWFSLDFSLWLDMERAAVNDELTATMDYSIAIRPLQDLALNINCLTIERFSEMILNCLEEIYGLVPMKILLCKCSPPINGFDGNVTVERCRHFPKF